MKSIIIVDVQNGFINPDTEHIPARIRTLLDNVTFDHRIFTKFINLPGSQFENLIHWSRLQSPPETDIVPILAGQETTIIKKNYYSCTTTDFHNYINQYDLSEFYICGIDTDVCVMKAAVDLFEEDLRPIVLIDCCASHGGYEFHEFAGQSLRRLIGNDQLVYDTEAHFGLPIGLLKS